jgi:hypothetical protein
VALTQKARYLTLNTATPTSWGDGPWVVNANGDYTYLTDGYYRSLDLEQAGERVIPTSAECLDAYVVPIALAKASRSGIGVPNAQLITDRFPAPPLMAYPVNPFSSRGELLLDSGDVELKRKGLTYTGKYAVLCQTLPRDHRIDVVRVVLGHTSVAEYRNFANLVWETFRIPLMKVRVIVVQDAFLLSAIEPLPYRQLTPDERQTLERNGTWRV